MYRGVIPESLNLKAFNAAYVSQSVDLDCLIFDSYKENLINLKYLVLGMSYSSLFSALKDGKEKWRLKNYNLYYPFCLTLRPENYSELLSNTYAVNQKKITDYYFKNNNEIRSTKFGNGAINREQNLEKTGVTAAKRHTKKKLLYYKYYLKKYDSIIKYCEAKNIKIIFLTTPAYISYTDNLDAHQLSQMNNVMDSLSSVYQNITWLNHLKNKQFIKNDFINADHLNIKGAKKLTKKLNQCIDSLQKPIN